MSFPTASQSKFAQPDWQEHFKHFDHTNFEIRGNASAAEVLAATDTRDVISPTERLRALADAPPTLRSKLDRAATDAERVEPARAERTDPEPEEEAAKPAASVFAALTQQAVRVAACPVAKLEEEMARNNGRLLGKANSVAIASTWNDEKVRTARLVREGVQVLAYNGEVRRYKSVREAFELLRLNVKAHIRFRVALKEAREKAYVSDGKTYMFKLVPRT